MFKDRLNKLRVDAGLSQVELAKKIGVSAGAIGNYESGARPPKPEIAARLAEFFNVPVEDLVNGRALTRNEYKAFAQEVEDALDLITDEDLEVMQLDAAGIRRALRQRRPIREDRARALAEEVGVHYDSIMRKVLPDGEDLFEAPAPSQIELQLLADFRKLNAEAQAFVAENVHHLATLEKYAK